jgi:hypothetical protein
MKEGMAFRIYSMVKAISRLTANTPINDTRAMEGKKKAPKLMAEEAMIKGKLPKASRMNPPKNFPIKMAKARQRTA